MSKFKAALLLLLITVLFSCHTGSADFTTEKWTSGDGITYPMRDDILDNLLKTHQLKGMTYKEVQHLLGYPNWSDSTQHKFYYQIIETHTNMRKLDHVKNLVFYMSKDSVVTRYEVYDHKYKYKK